MAEEKRFIEYMPISQIQGAPTNPKAHDHGTITTSMRRFGYVESMTVDDRTGRLVAGHGRLELLRALKARGKKPPDGVEVRDGEWWAPVQRGWSSKDDVEARAYVVTSNKSSEKGGWNEKLGAELAAIADDTAMALAGTGFDDDDLARLAGDDEGGGGRKKKGKKKGPQGDVFQVLVEVDSEEAQTKLLERLEREGFSCRPLIF